LRVPDRYVSEVVLSGMAVFVFNVHDASVFEGHLRSESGFSQRQGDIVSLAKMFVDQRLQGEIRQKVAAVDDEWLRSQETFHILDAAAGSEQDRLVLKSDFTISIRAG